LNNIALLISQENLNKSGVPVSKKVDLQNLVMAKVYVKNEADFEKVKSICEKHFPKNLPVNYVVADVCRPEWLVEIEGIAMTEI
jgi:enamine deaminase RidA (YjgF/YER057c/UK114 family)